MLRIYHDSTIVTASSRLCEANSADGVGTLMAASTQAGSQPIAALHLFSLASRSDVTLGLYLYAP